MDTKKDIQKSSTGIEGGQTSGEPFGISVTKKSDRLATALYLVTNFLSDNEPLKNRLRTLSLDLVRLSASVRYGSTTPETIIFENFNANIIETLSLLELAFISGLVSEMNFTILKREYDSLKDKIQIKQSSRESRTDTILEDNFFENSTTVLQSRSNSSTVLSQRSNSPTVLSRAVQGRSGNSYAPRPFHKGHSIGQTDVRRSDLKNLSPRSVLGKSESTPRAVTDVAIESRRARILKLIKDKREVTIKDIATHFPELSEKTIQRELVTFVETGVLKKSGERRWSRYSLA